MNNPHNIDHLWHDEDAARRLLAAACPTGMEMDHPLRIQTDPQSVTAASGFVCGCGTRPNSCPGRPWCSC